MHSAVQLASVIGSTSFEDTERGIRFADEELLLLPDEMPAFRFDEWSCLRTCSRTWRTRSKGRGRRRPRCWQWRGGEDGRREAVCVHAGGAA